MKPSITALICLILVVLAGCGSAPKGDAEAFCSHKVTVVPQSGLPAPQSLAEIQEREKAPYWQAQEDASLSDCEKTTEAAAHSEGLSVGQYTQKHEREVKEAPEDEKIQEQSEQEAQEASE